MNWILKNSNDKGVKHTLYPSQEEEKEKKKEKHLHGNTVRNYTQRDTITLECSDISWGPMFIPSNASARKTS